MSEIRGDVGASREKMNGDCGQRRGSAKPPGRKFWLGFPGGSDSEESACNVGNLGLILGLGRSVGGGHGNPLQVSCLENPHGQRSGLQSMKLQRVGHD